MNTTDLNTPQNTIEDNEDAAEKQFNQKVGRAFLFLIYSLDLLVIGANIQVWGDLFGIL